MKIIQGKKKNEFLLQEGNNTLRAGYIYEFPQSKILEEDRMNYFIDIKNEERDDNFDYDKLMLDYLITVGKEKRKNYPQQQAFLYHCALSDNLEKISFFEKFDNLQIREGMNVLVYSAEKLNVVAEPTGVTIRRDVLNTNEGIEKIIKEHSRIFTNGYTLESIKELQKHNELECISLMNGEEVIANILIMIEEKENKKNGVIEDIFVNEFHRNKGYAKYLLCEGVNALYSKGIDNIELEVWSANLKAHELYKKFGFKFTKKSEISIGMYI